MVACHAQSGHQCLHLYLPWLAKQATGKPTAPAHGNVVLTDFITGQWQQQQPQPALTRSPAQKGDKGGSWPSKGYAEKGSSSEPISRTDGDRPRDTNYIQGLELPSPDPPGPECQAGHRASVVLYPAVLRDESINDFLHGQVGDELFLGQRAPGHGVKVAHTLQQELRMFNGLVYRDPSPKAHGLSLPAGAPQCPCGRR